MKRSIQWVAAPILLALAVCSLMLSGCAQEKLSDEEAYKRFVGTWVNTEYPGTLGRSQVTVIRPDYLGEDWLFPDSTGPEGQWTIKVKKIWVDKKSNIYCQYAWKYIKGAYSFGTGLMRVDKDGKVWEATLVRARETDFYPEVIDPQLHDLYYIYYRK